MQNSQAASDKVRILVITGTTGFESLLRNIDECRELEQDYELVLQTGGSEYQPQYKAYFSFDQNLQGSLDQYDFFITHAGAGSIFMLLEHERRVLVVPNTEREDKHQLELANYVRDQGLCAVCDVADVAEVIKEIKMRTAGLKPYKKVEFHATQDILDYIND